MNARERAESRSIGSKAAEGIRALVEAQERLNALFNRLYQQDNIRQGEDFEEAANTLDERVLALKRWLECYARISS